MKKLLLLLTIPAFTSINAQNLQQRFDGADTTTCCSIFVQLDTSAQNIWQIGKPQKQIFDSAASLPNVLITDTVNYYPVNNNSSAYVTLIPGFWGNGILAIQWMQKLDMDRDGDGAMVEYSFDNGATFNTVFNSPYVYNFYGYDPNDLDTLASTGEPDFSGTDSLWHDVWLCFDNSFLQQQDTFVFRFRFASDSVNNNKEGWMIDNLLTHMTMIHTARGEVQKAYLNVYPSLTDGVVNIEAMKLNEYHIIEKIEVLDNNGRVVKKYGVSPTKFRIDLSDLPNGNYFIKVVTNYQTQTVPVVLKH